MATVSVVIRNRNEAEQLRGVLTRLRAQRTQPLEIIVVDNESTDDSRDVIRDFNATLVSLPLGQFTYGRATNLGFEHSRGDLVLMLSSHSFPVGTYFLDEVTAPFSDLRVAAVRIPIAGNSLELRNVVGRLSPLDRNSTAKDVFGRGPAASGSVIRRSVWERVRVDELLEAAEDKEWAMRVLRESDWTIPTVNACYVYAKTYTSETWLKKLLREERAGFFAAGLKREVDWIHVAKTVLAGMRDVWRRARTESALNFFRRGLR